MSKADATVSKTPGLERCLEGKRSDPIRFKTEGGGGGCANTEIPVNYKKDLALVRGV